MSKPMPRAAPSSFATWAARPASRPDTTTSSPLATPRLAISLPIPEVPPMTSNDVRSGIVVSISGWHVGVGQQVGQVLPVAREPVGMPARRLRRLSLEPAHRPLARVGKAVHAADAGPGDVTDFEPIAFTVELGVGGAFDNQVGLLERMIVLACLAVRVVLHHEHGRQLGTQIGVDHHLDGNPAVDKQGGAHARGYGKQILTLLSRVHVVRADVAELTGSRIPNVNRRRITWPQRH